MIKNIRHTGIVTQNLKKALYFYKDLLGFLQVTYYEEKDNEVTKLLNLPNDVTLIHTKLAIPTLSSTKLELGLIQNPLLELYAFKMPHRIGEVLIKLHHSYGGYNHLAFTVDDIEHIYHVLRKHRIKFINSPIKINNKKIAFCRDYDDNLLELVEELK